MNVVTGPIELVIVAGSGMLMSAGFFQTIEPGIS